MQGPVTLWACKFNETLNQSASSDTMIYRSEIGNEFYAIIRMLMQIDCKSALQLYLKGIQIASGTVNNLELMHRPK